MTFSVSRDHGIFEWAGKNLSSLFCQPMRVLDRNMWRMVYDIFRFNACARRILHETSGSHMSIGEYLKREGYSEAFRDNYLVPMTAAIWSTPPDKCALDFPAQTLIRFMSNHNLLQILNKPAWLTLRGGSRIYVQKIISSLPPAQLHLSSPVRAVSTFPTTAPFQQTSKTTTHEVSLQLANGKTEVFDHVILACHADAALEILRWGGPTGGLTEEEQKILGMFSFSRNEVMLHSDVTLMPKKRAAWSCWNYLTFSGVDQETGNRKANVDKVALTYWMNDLQHLAEEGYGPILVTLNPPFDPAPAKVVAKFKYDHPVIDSQAVQAQDLMASIQNIRGIGYAGAWLKYGFHEDGFTSGLRAALALQEHAPIGDAIRPPFQVRNAEYYPVVNVFLASSFEVLEGTGVRAAAGFALGLLLDIIGALLLTLLRVIPISIISQRGN
ncbi:hypothetical protein PsYK624_048590 [Phanerochaete sordida]|uniref:Amine oxidase domain-containing protein n=1 Tax=Phanerochaete sordida TaxID=48140 RepID=A0A9P3G437_9APHY|nr:hypothetical protein PsYK624_048590 [Phanerochaete sordida]